MPAMVSGSGIPPTMSDDLDRLQLEDGDDSIEVAVPDFHYDWGVKEPAPAATGIASSLTTTTAGATAGNATAAAARRREGYSSHNTPSPQQSIATHSSASSGHVLTDASTISGGSSLPTPPEGLRSSRYGIGLGASGMGMGMGTGSAAMGAAAARSRVGEGAGVGSGAGSGMGSGSGSDGSGGQARRTFQRVVSAPIQRMSPSAMSSGSPDESRSTAYAHTATIRPPLLHSTSGNTINTTQTLNQPHPHTQSHSHTANMSVKGAYTPGVSDRSGAPLMASTSRRIGGLSRFGGPARRVLKEEPDEASTPPLIPSPKAPSPAPPSPPLLRPLHERTPPNVGASTGTRTASAQGQYAEPEAGPSRRRRIPSRSPSADPDPATVGHGGLGLAEIQEERGIGHARGNGNGQPYASSQSQSHPLSHSQQQRIYETGVDRSQSHSHRPPLASVPQRPVSVQHHPPPQPQPRMPSPPPAEKPFRPFESHVPVSGQPYRDPRASGADTGQGQGQRPTHAYSYSADPRPRDPHYAASRAAPMAPVPAPANPSQAQTLPAAPMAHSAVATGKRTFVVNSVAYERIGTLGKGGSSKVYSVLCAQTRSMYAMKRVALDRADFETYQSYTNEIELLKRLRGHDRIIQLVDHQTTFGPGNRPKLLMMVLECGEIDFALLLDEQKGQPLNMNFVGMYWGQMLEAVQAVHQENVVHTDLKPANFVLVKGRLKIIDFGIAKAVANDTVNIQRDQQIGTVNYMSPEAIQRMNNQKVFKLSYPSDVWSLGCILYQMIYGNPPFQHIGGGPLPKMNTIADPSHVIDYPARAVPKGLQDPEAFAIDVPPAAIDAMKRCLMYRKEQRLTIPELLVHEFLRPKMQTSTLPQGATSITEAQMRMLVNFILQEHDLPKLAEGNKTARDLFEQLSAQNALSK